MNDSVDSVKSVYSFCRWLKRLYFMHVLDAVWAQLLTGSRFARAASCTLPARMFLSSLPPTQYYCDLKNQGLGWSSVTPMLQFATQLHCQVGLLECETYLKLESDQLPAAYAKTVSYTSKHRSFPVEGPTVSAHTKSLLLPV